MILPFSEKFPWGEPTLFEEKLNIIKEMPSIGIHPKIHTIRKDLAGRWRAGRTVQGYYNSRTKNMRKIFDGECKSIQFIEIKYEQGKFNPPCIYIETKPDFWHKLNQDEIELLAINDGFNSSDQFFKWFSEDFEGKIIHFTDFKY